MLISQAFPSKFLKAADLQGKTVRAVMQHVEMQDVGDDEFKPVLFFQGKAKGLVLNKTNANNIALIYGDETSDWFGHELLLYPTMVDYQGRSVDAIRVRAPRPNERRYETARAPEAVVRHVTSAMAPHPAEADFEVVEDQGFGASPNQVSSMPRPVPASNGVLHGSQPIIDDEIPF